MNSLPVNNVKEVLGALVALGIKNRNVLIGTLCCIAKESGFVPKDEFSYKHTDSVRLQKLFHKELGTYTIEQIDALKQDDIKFYDVVYGGQYGNTVPGDGFKYRGRGFNQITFKNLYVQFGKMINENLVDNPDALDDIKIAAKACAAFFVQAYKQNAGYLASRYKVANIADVKDVKTGLQIAVNANAGWRNDTRGGQFDLAAQAFLSEVTTIFNNLASSFNI